MATAPNPILDASTSKVVPGLITTDLTPSAGLNVATTTAGEADVRDFDFGGDGTIENDLEFTPSSVVRNALSIDSTSISQWRNGEGAVDGMAFEVNVDGAGFAHYNTVQVDPASDNGPSFDTFTFDESISEADSMVIRFAARHVNPGSTGKLHINGLQVTGTVAPEPTSALLCCAGSLALLRRRR